MEKNFNRALRRHHLARVKANRASHYGGVDHLPEEGRLRAVGIYANTAALCSCRACANPRRHTGEVTLAEVSATEAFRIAFDDLANQAKRK